MNKVQVVLNNFSRFEQSATPVLFIEIFKGERLGNHLWDKYTFDCQYSILKLWRMLKKEEQVNLSTWILDNEDDLYFLRD